MAGAFVLGALDAGGRGGRARAPRDVRRRARGDRRAGWRAARPGRERAGRRAAGGLKARIMAAAAADLEERTAGVATADATTDAATAAAEPTPFPTASERTARRARTSHRDLDPAHRGGRRDRRAWPAGTCCSRTSSTRPRPISAASRRSSTWPRQPGSLTAILDAGRRDRLRVSPRSARTARSRSPMRDLAPTSGSTVYTTWAIGGDGVPVALGDFTVGSDGTGTFEAAAPRARPRAPSSP